jgi:hypothetical protein
VRFGLFLEFNLNHRLSPNVGSGFPHLGERNEFQSSDLRNQTHGWIANLGITPDTSPSLTTIAHETDQTVVPDLAWLFALARPSPMQIATVPLHPTFLSARSRGCLCPPNSHDGGLMRIP